MLHSMAVQDQRLIYSGKLLPDVLLLKDALRKEEERHMLHLVCKARSPTNLQKAKVAETTEPPGGSSLSMPAATSVEDGVRHRGTSQTAFPSPLTDAVGLASDTEQFTALNPALRAYAMYNPQQLFWLQHIYAQQYYARYQAAVAAAAAASSSANVSQLPVVPPAAPPALPNQVPAVNLPADGGVQPPANAQANQNLRMNAQGGPLMEEEEDMNRDWLDWIYTAARFSIFLSILYFYSSLSRFFLVSSAMVLMYLHHVGWFPFRRRPVQPVPVLPQPAQAPHNPNIQDEPVNADQENSEQVLTAATEPERYSFLSTVLVFLKTFFASLIPEGPPALAN
ncbi:homocysteine-responsive endoplasmic reticulum-resident ubiquitin-like domain member 1 protein isoform X2 [Protopterus annectens]|uniref:homocysteine-responsive endoplasmic reticulum-resident ubiquitin-like domain member 1 protein isoform X2 n=1 Tax=Protopterus annectens TaxID=7888 RepID=UPI001CFA0E34|nr:homocysteine-responsive endoplasmic reticulum-resident ubiquitin-like domain member 1 protein isoform X2 [Protopterus annectens]